MFTSYHVPLEERNKYPANTYFAIYPRPLLPDSKPIAVVIPELDVTEDPSSNRAPNGSATEGPHTDGNPVNDVLSEYRKDSEDLHLRRERIKRPFKIASPKLEQMCLVEYVATESAHYVYAADGALLARIYRTPGRLYPWPRRVRWHLEVAHSDEPSTRYSAPQGTIRAWTSFVIFSPLWVALILLRLLGEFLDSTDTDYVWGLPIRAKWRTGVVKWGLDYHGVGNTYYINPKALDPRVAYAQAIIHNWTPRREKKNQSQ
ncbi:hypothetical protein [Streptomyces montanisoli]|uniref:Uncharacterized protein n=1 Tax=Streptomyces montanisoli TaxID=2798581 RepID=A0A940MCC6_9ACTN|nr:hypothetical protein [Streptomyces montanisoli]MBP0458674.1 hypothetical protein [Streptomyces montanisoli]